MANRKFAMIDNNGLVVAVIPLNDEDTVKQGIVAALLSGPECFEFSLNEI